MLGLSIVSEASLTEFANEAWANHRRLRSVWIISPWLTAGRTREDPLSFITEAVKLCSQVWIITRTPEHDWHRTALRVLAANARPQICFNDYLHTKLYILECDGYRFAMVGSPNLTSRANRTNKELAVAFRTSRSGRADMVSAAIDDLTRYARELTMDESTKLQEDYQCL
jgi:phosphatidylserine/phosphatidylglycerophosphate/cardiolipin synthase-like enzyme